jgi:hypothetical protein
LFKIGLNIDTNILNPFNECADGIYFYSEHQKNKWEHMDGLIFLISIPDDANVIIYPRDKLKTDKIIIEIEISKSEDNSENDIKKIQNYNQTINTIIIDKSVFNEMNYCSYCILYDETKINLGQYVADLMIKLNSWMLIHVPTRFVNDENSNDPLTEYPELACYSKFHNLKKINDIDFWENFSEKKPHLSLKIPYKFITDKFITEKIACAIVSCDKNQYVYMRKLIDSTKLDEILIKTNPHMYRCIPQKIANNQEFINKMCIMNPKLLYYMHDEARSLVTQETINTILDSDISCYDLLDSYDSFKTLYYSRKAIEQNIEMARHLPEQIVNIMISEYPNMYQYINEYYKNKENTRIAVNLDPKMIKFAPRVLLDDDIIIGVLIKEPSYWSYVSWIINSDKIYDVLKYSPDVFKHMETQMKTKEMCEYIIKINPKYYCYIPKKFKTQEITNFAKLNTEFCDFRLRDVPKKYRK